MRIVDYFDKSADTFPDRVFSVDALGSSTYAEAQVRTHKIANALIKSGIREGMKVAVYSPNCSAALDCIYGLNRAGAVWVPLNSRNGIDENVFVIDQFDVKLLLYHSSLRARVDIYLQRVRGLKCAIAIDGDGPGTLQELFKEVSERAPNDLGLGVDRIASVFPTGGTTGQPKGVMHTNLNWMVQIASMAAGLPPRKPVVNLVIAPLTHAAGAIAVILTAQAATHVILPSFDAELILQAIEKHKITQLFLPPTALYMLLAHPHVRNYDYSSLEYFLYAAAPSSVDKIKEAISVFGPVMAQCYGQTEAPTTCTFLPPWDHHPEDKARVTRMASCGRPTVMIDLRIMSPEGHIQSVMQPGEIVVRGPLVMAGYYKNAEMTSQVIREGWLHTGDIGYMDQDGYIYVVDRLKDVIISGGYNIYPSEIEHVVWSHDSVQDCAVIGVPDEKWGEAVKLVVEPKPNVHIDPAAIAAFCKERLGSVKVPKSIEIWSSLPRSANGKVLKRELRAKFWEGQSRKI